MKNDPIIIERTFHAPVEKVWHAITDKDAMKQWYFDLPAFEAVEGFEFQFYGGTESRQYLHLCRVTEAVPLRKLQYSWRYDGYAGNSFVTLEMFPEGDQTFVRLTHDGNKPGERDPGIEVSNDQARDSDRSALPLHRDGQTGQAGHRFGSA